MFHVENLVARSRKLLQPQVFSRNAQNGSTIACHISVLDIQGGPDVQMFALRMVTLATMLVLYRVSPVLGIAALSIGTGYIVGQRMRRPATASR